MDEIKMKHFMIMGEIKMNKKSHTPKDHTLEGHG